MTISSLSFIQELSNLWYPIYPYLAQHIQELYTRQDGNVLEIGPFTGVIFTLQEKNMGSSFTIAAFPPGMGNFFRQEAKKRKLENKIKVIESDPSLTGINENTIDLAIFRGAFFFPSLGEANLLEIHRVLKKGGVAFIGGGYGKYTPDLIIGEIGKKSKDLNLRLGKIYLSEEKLWQNIQAINLEGEVKLISEGGLWVLMKK